MHLGKSRPMNGPKTKLKYSRRKFTNLGRRHTNKTPKHKPSFHRFSNSHFFISILLSQALFLAYLQISNYLFVFFPVIFLQFSLLASKTLPPIHIIHVRFSLQLNRSRALSSFCSCFWFYLSSEICFTPCTFSVVSPVKSGAVESEFFCFHQNWYEFLLVFCVLIAREMKILVFFYFLAGMKRIRDDVYGGSQFKRPFGSSRGES